MLFTSYEFIGFIIVLAVLYYVLPRKFQGVLLLLASYAFYACADVRYVPFLLVTTLTTWAGALVIDGNHQKMRSYLAAHKSELTPEERKKVKKDWNRKSGIVFAITIVWNLLVLATLKVSRVAGWNLIVPLGISFYAFQAVGYLIDVYREDVDAEKNILKYALFVSFFPQLIQGPINRFEHMSKTLFEKRGFSADVVFRGVERILWGYFKKLVVADRILIAVRILISDTGKYGGGYAFLLIVLYTIELYADFTGGIDIAIGVGEMLGINMQENFKRPFFSTSLAEYWRRWHMTMCSWFRDYLFYPVSTSKFAMKLSKLLRNRKTGKPAAKVPLYLAGFVTWLSTGLWHDVSWNFVTWGLLNYAILMISMELEPAYKGFHDKFSFANTKGYAAFMMLRTFLLVCCLNLFDCFANVSETLSVFASVFQPEKWQFGENPFLALGLRSGDWIVLCVACVLIFIVELTEERTKKNARDLMAGLAWPVRILAWNCLLMATLVFGTYGIGYDSAQFIYNRF